MRGSVGKDGKVLIIEAIHVIYTLHGVADDQRDTVERVHDFHAGYCPVARSIEGCIDITTEFVLAD